MRYNPRSFNESLAAAKATSTKHNRTVFLMITAYGWKIAYKNLSAYSQPCFKVAGESVTEITRGTPLADYSTEN